MGGCSHGSTQGATYESCRYQRDRASHRVLRQPDSRGHSDLARTTGRGHWLRKLMVTRRQLGSEKTCKYLSRTSINRLLGSLFSRSQSHMLSRPCGVATTWTITCLWSIMKDSPTRAMDSLCIGLSIHCSRSSPADYCRAPCEFVGGVFSSWRWTYRRPFLRSSGICCKWLQGDLQHSRRSNANRRRKHP